MIIMFGLIEYWGWKQEILGGENQEGVVKMESMKGESHKLRSTGLEGTIIQNVGHGWLARSFVCCVKL